MAAQKKEKQINLLPQEEFAASPLGRVVTWLMSTFRVIVIMTEMVVMLAFLSRFWLDTQIADLDEKIKAYRLRIEAFSQFEKDWRGIQNRLKIFSQLTDESNKQYPVVTAVSAFMPSDVSLSAFTLTRDQFQMKGTGISEQSVSQFLINLEATKRFDQVDLSQIESGENDNIIFTITAKLKPVQPVVKEGGV